MPARLFMMELKNAFITVAGTFLASLAIVCVGIFLLGYHMGLWGNTEKEAAMILGMVVEDNEEDFGEILSYVNEFSTVKSFCSFKQLKNTDEGIKQLQSGEIAMLMVVPKDFVSEAEHMVDTRVTVYVPGSISRMQYRLLALFSELETIMFTTENSILSMYDTMECYELDMSINEMENDLLLYFVMNYLTKSMLFDTEYITAYGEYTPVQFYMVAAYLIILFMCGIGIFKNYSAGILQIENIVFNNRPRLILWTFIKVWINMIPIFVLGLLLRVPMAAISDLTDGKTAHFGADTIMLIMLVSLCISSVIHVFAQLFKAGEAGSAYLLFIGAMSVLSANLLSAYYLPRPFMKTCDLWPMGAARRLLLGVQWGYVPTAQVWYLVSLTIGFMAVASWLYLKRLKRI